MAGPDLRRHNPPIADAVVDVEMLWLRALRTRTGLSITVRGPLFEAEAQMLAKLVHDGRVTMEEA